MKDNNNNENSDKNGDNKSAGSDSNAITAVPMDAVRKNGTDVSILEVSVGKIFPNPNQPRKTFNKESMEELTHSIQERGVLQPLLVRRKQDGNGFEIIAGERRWRAAKKAGLTKVPVCVKDFNDLETMEVALIENIQRHDLNVIEEGLAYQKLMQNFHYTQDQLARSIGKSRSHIANILRMAGLPINIKMMIITGQLTPGHGKILAGRDDAQKLAQEIVEKKASVKEANVLARKNRKFSDASSHSRAAKLPKGGTRPEKEDGSLQENNSPDERPEEISILESQLAAELHTDVSIFHKEGNKGEIRIAYRNITDLDEVCQRLMTRHFS